MRDSHTITRFLGRNALDSAANVKPNYALDGNNVIGATSGELWVARATRILIDFGQAAFTPFSSSRIVSLGLLDTTASTGDAPRVFMQQGGKLYFADAPGYAAVTAATGVVAPANPGRLDYAQVANVLYCSSGTFGGKFLPANKQFYQWGIAQSSAPKQVLSTTMGSITVQRTGGITTVTFTSLPVPAFVGDPILVDSDPSAPWPASFAGTFAVKSVAGLVITYAQPGLPNAGPFTRAVFTPGITAATGYQYRGCFGSSLTGHFGTASPVTPTIGPLAQQSPVIFSPIPPADPQIDTYALFRNLDNGGDWYLVGTYPLPAAGPFPLQVAMLDTTTDTVLESSAQTPPYDNGVSPNGKYIMASGDRVVMCGIPGQEDVVAYTGYESIPFGRPQESWPRFNQLNVGQGQCAPVGLGNCRYGTVIFCTKKVMYILNGNLSDVTTSAVTPLSFGLRELPFKVGLYSHFSVQSTPQGVIFLDDSFNLQMFDGYFPPTIIAPVLKGVLATMTPGSQDVVTSAFIPYLDRQWYILSFPANGSVTNNRTIIVDLTVDGARNTGAWVFDYSLDAVLDMIYADGTRHAICAQSQTLPVPADTPAAGWLTELPLTGYAPGDALLPGAHYRTGYIGIQDEDGIDEWAYFKLFRFIRMMTEQGLTVYAYLVDGDKYTFTNPLVKKFTSDNGVYSVNTKCRACSLDIIFPDNGSGDPLTGITVNWNFTGKR